MVFRRMHAQKHFDNSHHPVVLHINQKMPFCYECDEFVLNDHQRGYISMFREQISRLQNQTFERSTTRRGTEIRSAVTRFQFVDPKDDSKRKAGKPGFSVDFTARRHYQLALLKRCIMNWKRLKDIPAGTLSNLTSPMMTAASSRVNSPQRQFAGRTGLRNVGNTCYQNATLMALSSFSLIRELFSRPPSSSNIFKRRSSEEIYKQSIRAQECNPSQIVKQASNTETNYEDNSTVLMQLQNLFRIIWSGKWAGICPAFFVKSFMASSPTFRGYMQHDAHEFYTALLESITSCTKDPRHIRESIEKSLTCYQISLTSCYECHSKSTYEFPGNTCITLDIDTACCRRFNDEPSDTTSNRYPRRSATIYDVPRHCHLNDCLRVIAEPVQLIGNSLYRCESKQCGGSLAPATKRDSFRSLPPCIVFHINRTKWDSRGKRKILHRISFPLKDLDLSCIASEGSAVPGKYVLKGVVLHHGQDIDQGHYTSICYREEIKSYVAFNDLTSEIMPEKDLVDNNYEGHPYLLLYERR